ncbi:MAG: hypothetical protein PHE47_06150 [Oscillospiraceae bacterium]|nr:hypothetical protein [Oscillospiraceae bacterium]
MNEPMVRFFISPKRRLWQQNKESGRAALLAVCKRISLFIVVIWLEAVFQDFKLYIPENWSVDGNDIYNDEELLSAQVLEPVSANSENPFADTDVQYAGAISSEELTVGGYPCKSYHMQKEVTMGGMTGAENKLYLLYHVG